MSGHSGILATGFRSVTTRLIFWILLSSGLILLLTVVLSNSRSRAAAIRAAEREADGMADATIDHIREILRSLEEQSRLLSSTLEILAPSDSELKALLRELPLGNSSIHGAGLFLSPSGSRPGMERMGLYAHRDFERSGETILRELPGDSYWEQGWYRASAGTKEPAWSEPFVDEGASEKHLVRHTAPLHHPDGTFRGVVTVDLDLDALNRVVQESNSGTESPSPEAPGGGGGSAVILSRSGHVLAARDETRIRSREPLLDQLDADTRGRAAPVVERMLAGGAGFELLELGGQLYRAKYAPVLDTGWSVAVLHPEEEVLREVQRLRWLQMGLGISGLGLLAIGTVWLSRRLTRPLKQLAGSAGRLATGDLDCDLPLVESRDEIGTLTEAFHGMRSSLKDYIRELEETTRAKQRLESELSVARRIQMAMLPADSAGAPAEGYQLAARLTPARAVGGDLYDHFERDGKIFFLVADVSGKGVPAALFMARAKTLFETVAARESDPGAILRGMNEGLCAENEEGMFVTGACGCLEIGTGELLFASAGHDPPAHVLPDSSPVLLTAAGGPVMGLMNVAEFPVNRASLAPREGIVLYTDGVTEAQDPEGDYFTAERLMEIIGKRRLDDAGALAEAVLAAVRSFADAAPQSDDITVLVLRRATS